MYNSHRGTMGQGQPTASNSNNRLSDLFDQIRREFDVHAQDRAGEHDQSSKFLRFSESPNSTIFQCFITTKVAKDSPKLLLFPNVSSSPAQMIMKKQESTKGQTLSKSRLTRAENIVAAQMQEMEMVRQKVYELERNQMQIKQRYAVALVA